MSPNCIHTVEFSRPGRRSIGKRGGFTLVELLVVIGIIILIVGIAVPAVLHSLKTARRTRTVSDFQLIGTALEAYKSDFGDYPRFDSDATVNSLNVMQDRGARLLCRALLAPGPAWVTGSGTFDFDGANNGGTGQGPDGALGVGFRVRPPVVDANGNVTAGGKVYGPYIDGSKFQLGNPGAVAVATTKMWDRVAYTDATLLDPEGNPILYYPATPGQRITTATGQYVCKYDPTTGKSDASSGSGSGSTGSTIYPLYNAFDNLQYGSVLSPPSTPYVFMTETELQYLLGERSTTSQASGSINPPESAVTTQPYLLWSAGEDGIYGRRPAPGASPTPTDKTDDVTNFDLPPNLVKY